MCIFSGNTENFDDAFYGTTTDPGKIAVSIYAGIFSYSGWWVVTRPNFINKMSFLAT